MISTVVWAIILWFCLVLENVRPDLFPHTAVLIPAAVGCIFWCRTSQSIVTTGLFLAVQWVLHPTLFPLGLVVIAVGGASLVTGARRKQSQSRHGWWWRVVVLIVIAQVAHCLVGYSMAQVPGVLIARIPVVLTLTAMVLLAFRAASELGIRRV